VARPLDLANHIVSTTFHVKSVKLTGLASFDHYLDLFESWGTVGVAKVNRMMTLIIGSENPDVRRTTAKATGRRHFVGQ